MMAGATRPNDDLGLVDYVRDLTSPHLHAEHYEVKRRGTWYGQNHTTRVPSLIAQLVAASPSGAVQERDNSGFGSRPTARLEAVDTLIRIDHEAARWVRWLGHDDPGDRLDPRTGRAVHGSGTIACIRLLGALAPSQPPTIRRDLERDMRRWWTWARIISGWDSPPWRPDNTCPACGDRRTLRINLAAEVGFCVHDACRETWDKHTLGLLAEHIRVESEAERLPPPRPVPCMCRVDGLPTQGRWGLCPVCGSSVCVNAEAVAERETLLRLRARKMARLEQLERIAAAAARGRSRSERMSS